MPSYEQMRYRCAYLRMVGWMALVLMGGVVLLNGLAIFASEF